MAALLPKYQVQLDTRLSSGLQVVLTKLIRSTGATDTITLAFGANTTDGASVAQVRDAGEGAITIDSFDSSTGILTISGGTAGSEYTFASLHRHMNSSAPRG